MIEHRTATPTDWPMSAVTTATVLPHRFRDNTDGDPWARIGRMTASTGQPVTMLVTQRVNAEQLFQMCGHLPMPIFLWDEDDPQPDPAGFKTHASRMVSTVSVHGSSSIGNRAMITVSFLDGTSDRVLEPDDEVDIHMLMPGPDLVAGESLE
jgi:hypothetical protein